jgi:Na+/proline symporter
MFLAGYMVINLLPDGMGFLDAIKVAGGKGKMNIITTGVTNQHFDWKDKYNIWSGLLGGFFLSLSYFGADQSQVGRYLTAKSDKESKIGLLVNGLVKVPMQFLILLVGILVFSFYQYQKAPIYFDEARVIVAKKTVYKDSLVHLENQYGDALKENNPALATELRTEYKTIIKKAIPGDDANDTNFIFLRFVIDNLPKGLVGLLIAVIFLAAWGSIAAALNSLASCTVVDFHKKFINKNCTEAQDYSISKWYTFGWGVFSVIVAMFAYNLGNSLIEAVNILGSLFYGVILGIFLVAFWIKYVKGNAVFIASVISELLIILIYNLNVVSFLWLNVIGVILVILFSVLIQLVLPSKKEIGI